MVLWVPTLLVIQTWAASGCIVQNIEKVVLQSELGIPQWAAVNWMGPELQHGCCVIDKWRKDKVDSGPDKCGLLRCWHTEGPSADHLPFALKTDLADKSSEWLEIVPCIAGNRKCKAAAVRYDPKLLPNGKEFSSIHTANYDLIHGVVPTQWVPLKSDGDFGYSCIHRIHSPDASPLCNAHIAW